MGNAGQPNAAAKAPLDRSLDEIRGGHRPHSEVHSRKAVPLKLCDSARMPSLFVISRSSAFTYKGRTADPKRVSADLGVRYVLEGSFRRSGNRVRISAQLIDGETGMHIWSDRYDGELTDIFDLQDRMTENIVGAIEPKIRSAEIERARRKRPESLDAYDLTMRALPSVWAVEREANADALQLLEHAIALDPQYPLAHALAAFAIPSVSDTCGLTPRTQNGLWHLKARKEPPGSTAMIRQY